MNCYGCYTAIPDSEDGESVFCRTCEDRRKSIPQVNLSSGRLESSQYFEGFTDPFTQETL